MTEPFVFAIMQLDALACTASERRGPATQEDDFAAVLDRISAGGQQACPLLLVNPLAFAFPLADLTAAARCVPPRAPQKEVASSGRLAAGPVAAILGTASAVPASSPAAVLSYEQREEGTDAVYALHSGPLAHKEAGYPGALFSLPTRPSLSGSAFPASVSVPPLFLSPATRLSSSTGVGPESQAGSITARPAVLPAPTVVAPCEGEAPASFPATIRPFGPALAPLLRAAGLRGAPSLIGADLRLGEANSPCGLTLAQAAPAFFVSRAAIQRELYYSGAEAAENLQLAPASPPWPFLSASRNQNNGLAAAAMGSAAPRAFFPVSYSDGLILPPGPLAKENLGAETPLPADLAPQEGQANTLITPYANKLLARATSGPMAPGDASCLENAGITEQATDKKNSHTPLPGLKGTIPRSTPEAGAPGLTARGDAAPLQKSAFSPFFSQPDATIEATASMAEPQPSLALATSASERMAVAQKQLSRQITEARQETPFFSGASEPAHKENVLLLRASRPLWAKPEEKRTPRPLMAAERSEKALRPLRLDPFAGAQANAFDGESVPADVLQHMQPAIKEQASVLLARPGHPDTAPTPPARLKLEVATGELGKTWLEVRQEGPAIHALAVAENPQTAQLVQHTEERIRAALGELGLQLQGFSVSTESGQQQPSPFASSPPGQQTHLLSFPVNEEAMSEDERPGDAAGWLGWRRIGHTVDYYA